MLDDRRATRAVILAAGRGSRLGRRTARRPKCLVRLAGRPLLDWQLAALRAAGIAEVAVVRGYRAASITRAGLATFDNPAWATSNMVASLLRARAWLAEAPCLVVYGDVVTHPDLLRRLAQAPHELAIGVDRAWRRLWTERFPRPEDDAESLRVRAGRVVEIGGRIERARGADGQYMGLLRFTPAALAATERTVARLAAPTARALQTTQLLALLIADGAHVAAVGTRGRWCEVDTERDLALYEARLATRGWSHDWRVGWSAAGRPRGPRGAA